MAILKGTNVIIKQNGLTYELNPSHIDVSQEVYMGAYTTRFECTTNQPIKVRDTAMLGNKSKRKLIIIK